MHSLTNPDEHRRGADSLPLRFLSLSLALVVTCLGLSTVGPAVASQQLPPHPAFYDFRPLETYVLEVNGVASAEAQILVAEHLPAFLIVAPELASAAILTPRTGMAQSVNTASVAKQPNGTLALLGNATLASEGRFQVIGRDVSFTVAGSTAVLKEKPFLLGLQDVAGMEASSSGYRTRSRDYTPYASALDELRSFPTDVKVRVYFGSWCPFCSLFVPRLMKVAQELDGSRIQVEFYGLPQPATDDPIVLQLGIEAVPTGIVYIGDEEVARMLGNMWETPEISLKVLLENHR